MAEPVCPYCRMPFDEASPPRIFCTACGMPHHEDCYQENGGCTVFGCKRAPADDPKLQVSQSDLSAVSVPVQPYAPVAQQYAPLRSNDSGDAAARSGARLSTVALQWAAGFIASGCNCACASSSACAEPVIASPGGLRLCAPAYASTHKSRTTYIVLGIFLGSLGIHNFYAGYTGRAVGQLCLTVLTLGNLGIASWIWAIIEICIVEKDSTGLRFS